MPAYVTNRTGRGVRARPVQGGKEVDVGLGEVYPLKMSHLDKRFMQAEMHGTCLAFAMQEGPSARAIYAYMHAGGPSAARVSRPLYLLRLYL